MTGLDLKLKRVAALVQNKELAAALGVTPGRLSTIESHPKPHTARMVQRYLEALETCATKSTSDAA